MPIQEQIKNFATTTLDGGINDSVTTLDVVDGSVFPDNMFRVVVSNEVMLCTSRTGNTLTVVRATEGTSAAGHTNGSKITHTLTPTSLLAFFQDQVPVFRCRPLDGMLQDLNGKVLALSDFTWVNQGAATASDNPDGSISIQNPTPSATWQFRVLAKPIPDTPIKLTVGIIPQSYHLNSSNTSMVGLGVRESSSGRIYATTQEHNTTSSGQASRYRTYNMSSASGSPSVLTSVTNAQVSFGCNMHQIEYDGTNITFRTAGGNGFHWTDITTRNATTDGYTFDQFVWFVMGASSTTNAGPSFGTLVSWTEEDA